MSSISCKSVRARRCAHVRGENHIFERQQFIVGAAGFFVRAVHTKSAKMAGPQRLQQRRTIKKFRPGHIDDASASLHLRQSLAADEARGRVIVRKLRNNPVAVGEQRFQRTIRHAELVLVILRQPGSLIIQRLHSERGCTARNLAADLAEADNAHRVAIEGPRSGKTPPIGSWRVTPVEWTVRQLVLRKLIDTDQIAQRAQLACQRQHQCESMFGAGDIGAAAHAEHFNLARFAGGHVDTAEQHSVFVNSLEIWRQGKFFCANRHGLNNNGVCRTDILAQFRLGLHQLDVARIKRTGGLLHLVAPALEIRQIRRHEIRKRGPSLTARCWIENHADQAQPDIVLDDDRWFAFCHLRLPDVSCYRTRILRGDDGVSPKFLPRRLLT